MRLYQIRAGYTAKHLQNIYARLQVSSHTPLQSPAHLTQTSPPCKRKAIAAVASSAAISQLSHRLTGRHRTGADGLDMQWILTSGYGF